MIVSVITAVRNDHRVKDAITSVLNQDYPHIQHVIVDGASTDDTVEIINSFVGKNSLVVSEPDAGLYHALNKGIALASGALIGFLNADDVFADSGVVSRIAEKFQQNPEVEIVHADIDFVDSKGCVKRRYRSGPFSPGRFGWSWTPAHPTFYTYKRNYLEYGGYNPSYRIAADGELMYRFLELYRLRPLYESSVWVRMSLGGMSTRGIRSTIQITREMRRAIRTNRGKWFLPKYILGKATKVREFFCRDLHH